MFYKKLSSLTGRGGRSSAQLGQLRLPSPAGAPLALRLRRGARGLGAALLGRLERLQDRRRDEDARAAAADRIKGGGAIVRVEQHGWEAALQDRVVEAGERCDVLAEHFDGGAVGQLRRQLRRRRLQAEGPLRHCVRTVTRSSNSVSCPPS